MAAADRKSFKIVLALVLIIAAALAVRVYHITDPLLEFHVSRQYRSAVIAHELYLRGQPSTPAWAREVAVANADQGALEPPLIEHLAVYGYRLAGGEHLWIGRAIAIFGWLIGSLAIWLIARRVMSAAGSLWALMVYLLAPYGVLASRSFQPDALMTGVTAVAILQIVRYAREGTRRELIAAITATAVAALIKPMSLFFTFPCFLAMVWPARREEVTRSRLFALETWTFLLLSLVPMAAYYAYGLFVTGAMQQETGGRFLPQLIASRFFWGGWFSMAQRVADWWLWPLAIAGTLMARPGVPRRLFAGLWAGYLLLGVVFTYHIATHDYYHLPALILVALASGAAITRIEEAVARLANSNSSSTSTPAYRRLATVAVAVVMLLTAGVWMQRSTKTLRTRDRSADLATYQRIGDLLQHSQRTIMLANDYGMPIRYHGVLTGPTWPSAGDLLAAQKGAGAGAAADSEWSNNIGSARQRYDEFYSAREPEYFLITDFDSFHAQPDLQQFLDAHFERLIDDEDDGFLIYDLRQKTVPAE
jgi:4-amino-4-deoxy-L-arabinose transferase-like glycosyltransferase